MLKREVSEKKIGRFQTDWCVSFRDNIESVREGWKDQGFTGRNWVRLEDWKRQVCSHLKQLFIKPHLPAKRE